MTSYDLCSFCVEGGLPPASSAMRGARACAAAATPRRTAPPLNAQNAQTCTNIRREFERPFDWFAESLRTSLVQDREARDLSRNQEKCPRPRNAGPNEAQTH